MTIQSYINKHNNYGKMVMIKRSDMENTTNEMMELEVTKLKHNEQKVIIPRIYFMQEITDTLCNETSICTVH
jgi:hypothetical protein